MARIAYADASRIDLGPLIHRIVGERGHLLALYQMLLHSPAVADGWRAYLTAIRQESQLDGMIRELVIMRIAHLNRAPYEADQHRPIALREGLSQAQLDGLTVPDIAPGAFDARQRAVLAYVDAMTLYVQVEPAVFASVRAWFSDRALVELTATIAAYNMVSRFLEALAVRSDSETLVDDSDLP